MKKYAIYGAGNLGKEMWLVMRDIIASENLAYEFIGFIDDLNPLGADMRYGKVVSNMELIKDSNLELDVAIAINNPAGVQNIYNQLKHTNISFPNFLHPSVVCMDKDSLQMGIGNIVAPFGAFSFDVNIGDFNFFNTRASVGHHVEIGSFNMFNPNIQLSGNVKVGDLNTFGLNVGVIPTRKIGDRNTIGAGAILTRHIKDDALYVGNPAQKLKID